MTLSCVSSVISTAFGAVKYVHKRALNIYEERFKDSTWILSNEFDFFTCIDKFLSLFFLLHITLEWSLKLPDHVSAK